MNKLLLSGVGALALVAMTAGTVSAASVLSSHRKVAVVVNSVSVDADTGDNSQSNRGYSRGGGLLSSGNATVTGTNNMTTGTADAEAIITNQANNDCGCEEGDSTLSSHDDWAIVWNEVEVEAETGENSQRNRGYSRGGGLLTSGNASTAGANTMNTGMARGRADVWTVVNSSVVIAE